MRSNPPHLVLPLTVEPTKPRLCNDARFLNLWMQDNPFKLDHVGDLQRYVSRNSYQSVLDDKSGYDHILLTDDSGTFFGIQWGGWYFAYNTLSFGLKISPYVYHNTGLVATSFFQSLNIFVVEYLVFCILMIATTDNYKFRLVREYTLIFRLLMSVHLQLQNQPFFLWPIFLFNLGIF